MVDFKAVCPVTGETVTDAEQCRTCKIGSVYGCPVKQELAEIDAYNLQKEA